MLSRSIAAWIGLAAGALCAWQGAKLGATNPVGWALPVAEAVIAFGVVSAAALALLADLQVREVEEIVIVAPAHSGGHH